MNRGPSEFNFAVGGLGLIARLTKQVEELLMKVDNSSCPGRTGHRSETPGLCWSALIRSCWPFKDCSGERL